VVNNWYGLGWEAAFRLGCGSHYLRGQKVTDILHFSAKYQLKGIIHIKY